MTSFNQEVEGCGSRRPTDSEGRGSRPVPCEIDPRSTALRNLGSSSDEKVRPVTERARPRVVEKEKPCGVRWKFRRRPASGERFLASWGEIPRADFEPVSCLRTCCAPLRVHRWHRVLRTGERGSDGDGNRRSYPARGQRRRRGEDRWTVFFFFFLRDKTANFFFFFFLSASRSVEFFWVQ